MNTLNQNASLNKTVAVGLSGGVDSTLTALLLQEQGYNVVGLSMSIYNKDIPSLKPAGKSCYGPSEKQDIKDIQKWAMSKGMDAYIVDLSEEYKQEVLKYFKESYLSGNTPNPCIMCNQKMKFGLLADKAKEQGVSFDYFATGHYVRLEKAGNRFVIKKAVDDKKDQSYFLYRLTQEQLARTLFPLGDFTKEEVRQMARDRSLAVADKADSQDFYAGDYTDLLEQTPRCGEIVHTSGKVLGTHQGFWHYTIGQRKGLGVAYSEPLFVVDIDAQNNRVIVGDVSETLSTACYAKACNWVALPEVPHQPLRVMAKYRSAGRAVPATIEAVDLNAKESVAGAEVKITFDEPQKSVTRGQSVVFYGALDAAGNVLPFESEDVNDMLRAADTVLGGGIIL